MSMFFGCIDDSCPSQWMRPHSAPAQLPAALHDWLASLAAELLAPATRRAYRSAVRLWAEYVESDALAERRAALDVAIVLVMRDGLLRVSECAALRWTDVALNPDESATAVIHRRKTKSTTTAYFAPATVAVLLAAKVADEPRVIPLSPRQIARRFKAACEAAGVVGATSHGARVGMAQDLAASGIALPDLMTAGGRSGRRKRRTTFATRRLPKDLWRGSTKRRLDAPSSAMWPHQRRMVRPLDAAAVPRPRRLFSIAHSRSRSRGS